MKTFFFHQKSEGILHLLSAGTLNQNLRLYIFCRYFQSEWGYFTSAGAGAITVYFWDEVFSLKIWGHFIQQCILALWNIVAKGLGSLKRLNLSAQKHKKLGLKFQVYPVLQDFKKSITIQYLELGICLILAKNDQVY